MYTIWFNRSIWISRFEIIIVCAAEMFKCFSILKDQSYYEHKINLNVNAHTHIYVYTST